MVCLYCSGDTAVVNSRPQHRTNQVWRRRRCLSCGAIFTTEESARREFAWVVSGNHRGRSQPFSRDKLFLSLYKSCEHRKTALEDAKGLTETVISRLAGRLSGGALSRQDIIGVAQVALNRFDKSASVHYAAYHKGT